jgi:hypothetical protein
MSAMGEQSITKRQDERYVIEQAKILARLDPLENAGDFRVALRDLKTAVAFLEAHGEEEGE